MAKTSVAFCTLGCKVNQYETDAMRERFEAAGYQIREFHDIADVYVVNTCSVTNIADRKSRQMLHRAKKTNPEGLVVAAGCYVQTAGEAPEKDPLIDVVVGNNLKIRIVDIVGQALAERAEESAKARRHVEDIAHDPVYEALSISHLSGHSRVHIKIQDGCNQFCSYCIIPYARGRVRSRRPEEIIDEVRRLADSACREVVLTGIHISSYGTDFSGHGEEGASDYEKLSGTALIELIEAIAAAAPDLRIRLSSLEPRIITEDFIQRLSRVKGFCPHFHLSLQSGCDATLRRMNRHYSTALYLEKCRLIRGVFPYAAITTDVIVGFPGETQEEFEETCAFLKEVAFADMHIFKYSRRQGTRAAVMPDQVPPQVQKVRSDILLALAEKMHGDFIRACMKTPVDVLLEEPVRLGEKTLMAGHSRNYILCAFEGDSLQPDQIVSGRLTDVTEGGYVICEKMD